MHTPDPLCSTTAESVRNVSPAHVLCFSSCSSSPSLCGSRKCTAVTQLSPPCPLYGCTAERVGSVRNVSLAHVPCTPPHIPCKPLPFRHWGLFWEGLL